MYVAIETHRRSITLESVKGAGSYPLLLSTSTIRQDMESEGPAVCTVNKQLVAHTADLQTVCSKLQKKKDTAIIEANADCS